MQERFPLGTVALSGLLLEQFVNVGIATVGIRSLGINEGFYACRSIARGPYRSENQAAELLLAPGG
jgi:hypothetical protein